MSTFMQEVGGLIQKYWMPLFIGVSILYVAYYIHGQLDRVSDTISLSLLPLVGSALCQIVFWVVSSHLWSVVLHLASSKKVSLVDSFFQLCLVNLGKYIPGKIWGMVARASYSKQKYDIDIGRMIQAIYIEQIYLLGSGLIVASLIAAAIGTNTLLWTLAPIITLSVIGATVYQKPLTYLIHLIVRLRKSDIVCELDDFHMPAMRMFSVLLKYMIVWLLLGMVMYGLYLSLFGTELSAHMASVITLSCIVGMSAGFVAVFSPGGVGVREAVSAAILAGHMPLTDAVLLVLLFRIWLAALEVLVGGTLYLGKRNKSA